MTLTLKRQYRSYPIAALILLLGGLTPEARAVQLDYTLGLGVERSDNIALTETDRIGETVLIPRLTFNLHQDGAVFQAQAAGAIEYRDYLQGTFSNEFRGQLAGTLNWIIAPDRLNWALEDYVGREPVNVFASNAPNNQQQTNVFSTGPTFKLHISPVQNMEADLRFTDTYAEKTKEFNGHRWGGTLRDIFDVNPTSLLSANAQVQRVRYNQTFPINFGYDRYDLYGRYLNRLDRLDLEAVLGYSRLDFVSVPAKSSPMLQLRTTWRITETDAASAAFYRQYTDAAQALIVDPASINADQLGLEPLSSLIGGYIGVQPSSSVISPSVYRETRGELSYNHTGERSRFYVAPYYSKFAYVQDSGLNQRGPGVALEYSYALSPLVTVAAFVSGARSRYTNLDRRDEYRVAGLRLVYDWSSHWSVRFDLAHNQRDSTAPLQSYRENVALVSVIFRR